MTDSEAAINSDLCRVVLVSLAVGLLFLIAVLAVGRLLAELAAESSIRWLAALTGVVLAGVAVAAMRSLGRMDELQRRMHSEAMAFGFLCSVLIVALYIFGEAAGLWVPPVHWLLPAMMSCWAIGVVMAFRRYR